VRINYKELSKKADSKKYKKLFEQKPFLTLHPLERMWWIRYEKLKAASKKTGWKKKFPKLGDGLIVDRPWFKLDHWINLELNVIQKFIESKEFDWEHLQDYRVDVVFCERHSSEGCDDCNYSMRCIIKMEVIS